MKRAILIGIAVIFIAIGTLAIIRESSAPGVSDSTEPVEDESRFNGAPIDRATERVTLKPFGLRVSPGDSPLPNEKFAGYHSGVDFEVFDDEKEIDVPIYALCDGVLEQKRTATGYGGIVVQSCTIHDEPVTVIYGHIRLSSVSADVGTTLKRGDQIAVLGTGESTETDGERKHLHLGIHKGTDIVVAGYVSTEAELDDWMNAMVFLQ